MANTRGGKVYNTSENEDKTMEKIIQYIDKKIDNMKRDIIANIEKQSEETKKSIEFISNQYDDIIKKSTWQMNITEK